MKKIIILIGFILNHYIGSDIKAHKSESPMNPQQSSTIEDSLQNETLEKNKTDDKNLLIIGGILGGLLLFVILGYGLYKLKNNSKNDQSYKGLKDKINKLFIKKNQESYSLIKRIDTFIEISDESFFCRINQFKNITLSITENSISLECKDFDKIKNLESLKETLTTTLTDMKKYEEYKKNQYILKLISFTIENLTNKEQITPKKKDSMWFLDIDDIDLENIEIKEEMSPEELKKAHKLVDIAADLIRNSQLTTVWEKRKLAKLKI